MCKEFFRKRQKAQQEGSRKVSCAQRLYIVHNEKPKCTEADNLVRKILARYSKLIEGHVAYQSIAVLTEIQQKFREGKRTVLFNLTCYLAQNHNTICLVKIDT